MDESNGQIRRSISMPVKPRHLEPEILKRSKEKETIYATDESEEEDNGTANYLRQRSSPAIAQDKADKEHHSDDRENDEAATPLRGLPRFFHSLKEFLPSALSQIFVRFRRNTSNSGATETANRNGYQKIECENEKTSLQSREIETGEEKSSEQWEEIQSNRSNDNQPERVIFSLS